MLCPPPSKFGEASHSPLRSQNKSIVWPGVVASVTIECSSNSSSRASLLKGKRKRRFSSWPNASARRKIPTKSNDSGTSWVDSCLGNKCRRLRDGPAYRRRSGIIFWNGCAIARSALKISTGFVSGSSRSRMFPMGRGTRTSALSRSAVADHTPKHFCSAVKLRGVRPSDNRRSGRLLLPGRQEPANLMSEDVQPQIRMHSFLFSFDTVPTGG